jgi:hypothetical protein
MATNVYTVAADTTFSLRTMIQHTMYRASFPTSLRLCISFPYSSYVQSPSTHTQRLTSATGIAQSQSLLTVLRSHNLIIIMPLFDYVDFERIYRLARDKGCDRERAIHRSLRAAVHAFLAYHNFKADQQTEIRLADNALENYKDKLPTWQSREAAVRLVLFDLNYKVARFDPDGRQDRPSYVPMPAGIGKYAFPEPVYSPTRPPGEPFQPAGTGRYAFPQPSYPGPSPHPSSNGKPYNSSELRTRFASYFAPRSRPGPPPGSAYSYSASPTNNYSWVPSSTVPNPRHPDFKHNEWPFDSSFRRDGAAPPPRRSTNSESRRSERGSNAHSQDEKYYSDFFSYKPRTQPRRPSPPPRPKTPPPPSRETATPDFYKVLGVERGASAQEIKAAYRKLSLKHHPDRVGEKDKEEATERMVEINAANEVLGDEEGRRWYDMYGVVKK